MKGTKAKQLRTNMTDAERRLWYRLRAHRFSGLKFKRQVPIGPYIVDFICFAHRLIIEVDGGQHAESEADRKRDAWLTTEGYHVLRFWNDDVLKHTMSVLEEIVRAVAQAQDTPLPARGACHRAALRADPLARHPLPQGERGR